MSVLLRSGLGSFKVLDSLCGRVVLVTGASSGIGREFALQIHRAGAKRIIAVARRSQELSELCDELNSVRPESAVARMVDLTKRGDDDDTLDSLVRFVQEHEIDILVNNAGFGSFGYFEEIDIEHEISMVALNVEATLRLAHAAIPRMKKQRTGGIISVSSIAGFQPLPYMATYAATKAVNHSHSVALREELKPFGVRVLTVCPGPVATEFAGVARVPGEVTAGPRNEAEDVVRESLAAFERNQAVVVPCIQAKFLTFLIRITPLKLSTWIAGKALERSLRAVRK